MGVLETPVTDAVDLATPGRLAGRLEFASLIVITDVDDGEVPGGVGLVRALLGRLAPSAQVVTLSEIDTARPRSGMLVHGRAHRLGASMGWQKHLEVGAPAVGERELNGAFVFRDPRPFHPGRLHEAISTQLIPERVGRIIRSRGFTRLASRPDSVGAWSTAGDVLDLDPTGMDSWDPDSPIGQEIVLFGLDLRLEVLEETLTSCLLNTSELLAGPTVWATYADPFPRWAIHRH